jgi:hypothetical protein
VYKDGRPLFIDSQDNLPAFLVSAYHYFGLQYPKFFRMDNLSKLGWLASELLLKDSFQPASHRSEDVGVVLSNSSASLDTDLKYYETVSQMASPSLFVYTLPNIMIGEICIRNNFKGENAFFIFDEFDAAFTKEYVSGLFASNALQVCICGWVELLHDKYKAALYLVQNRNPGGQLAAADGALQGETGDPAQQPTLFTTGNIIKLFDPEHG